MSLTNIYVIIMFLMLSFMAVTLIFKSFCINSRADIYTITP